MDRISVYQGIRVQDSEYQDIRQFILRIAVT